MSLSELRVFFFLQRYVRHVAIGAYALCASTTLGQAQEPMRVTVFVAEQGAVTERMSVVGTLAAREEIEVYSSISGKEIKQILVEAGQRVEAGQPLAVLDTTDALLALDKNAVSALRAEAAVAVENSRVILARVNESEAAKKLQRSRSLQPKGIVSDQVLDDHQNAYQRTVAELSLALQSLALTQADRQMIAQERREIELIIERSSLRAPSAGTIIERTARVGAMTSSSGSPLFRIARHGTVEFVSDVPDTHFIRLSEGMSAEFILAGRNRPLKGTLRLNAAQLNTKTRSGAVHIALDEQDNLTPGIFVRGVIDMETRTSVLLPGTAVRSASGSYSVYVVKNGIVEKRSVVTGSQQGNFVEVVRGVEAGEMIVLKAGGFLKDRERVMPAITAVAMPSGYNAAKAVSLRDTVEVVRR